MIVDHGCHDPAAVTAAVLADVAQTKEAEAEIRQRLGAKTVKVWREVKLFLDHKTLYYDTDPFLFYVMCECDNRGSLESFLSLLSAKKRQNGPQKLRKIKFSEYLEGRCCFRLPHCGLLQQGEREQ